MGWFNKKFVYEDKVFGAEMRRIYEETFQYRQKSDYELTYIPEAELVKDMLANAKEFVDKVIEFINL